MNARNGSQEKLNMSASTTGMTVDIPARSLFSWPPSPALTIVQIVGRSGLLLNNVVGVALCFAAGANTYSGHASFYVGGSFAVVSLLLVSIILIWNIRMLRNSSSRDMQGYERLESNEMDGSGRQASRLGMLMFATSIDILGLLAFLLVFPFTVVDAGDNWYGSNLLESYASVTCLPPL